MNELLNKINETFDNCMANSNDDTKLQLRILKNNINALFAEYESKIGASAMPYNNQTSIMVPEIEENDFEPAEVQYDTNIEFEDVVVEETPVSIPEPIQVSVVEETPVSIPEPIQVSVVEEPPSVNIPQATIPTPHPIQTHQPTMEEAFAVKNDKHSILIVDDSSIVRNYLERVFSEDYNVCLAVDGKDAIEKISNDEFIKNISLILLDLMMPNIDGFGVLEYISGRQLNVPIMIISGDNSKETINRAFQYNVVDVIEKPFDAQKIKDKMDRFINL